MAAIGRRNLLVVVREAPPGFYLDGGTHGEILLPGRYIPSGVRPGATMDVFVYRDSEDRLVATTETPLAMVGQFAYLRVVSVNPRVGVFLDWGLDKDLLLPLRELASPVRPGERRIVRVALDPHTDRIIASARLNRWLNLTPAPYAEGQRVDIMITGETPLGYNAIIGHAHRGLLYKSDLSGPLGTGQEFPAYVRALRADGKIDLALDRAGFQRIAPATEQIFAALQEAGGNLPYHDNSPPAEIRDAFGLSKKAFKQAIGALHRARRIAIEPTGIRVAGPTRPRS
ncbi:MAG: GntR family transcriptional regulator [Opitutus sp.]|nr:GntR family transcriptional regulator [Opitutus sp.]